MSTTEGSSEDAPNSHYLRIKVETPGEGFGVANEGFRGIGVEKDAEYTFSVTARRVDGYARALRVELEDANGSRQLGQTKITGLTPDWKKYTATLRADRDQREGAPVNLLVDGRGLD